MKRIGEHFVTCGQMKILEQRADASGVSYYQMMENAGTAAAHLIMGKAPFGHTEDEELPKVAEGNLPGNAAALISRGAIQPTKAAASEKAYIFCGKGNNGGDGFVVARLMHDAGYEVTVILVDGQPKTADAITNFELLQSRSVCVLDMEQNGRALMDLKSIPKIVVDAIYGTGFHGKLSGNSLKAAVYINKFSRKTPAGKPAMPVTVVSLDIPSGLGGDLVDEKSLEENSIVAHHTITFHAKKPVHLQKFAKPYCGEISVVDIGIDEERLWEIDFQTSDGGSS